LSSIILGFKALPCLSFREPVFLPPRRPAPSAPSRGDALFGRRQQFGLLRQVGEKVDELFDMALEGDGGEYQTVVAERFRGAEFTGTDIDLLGLAHAPRDLAQRGLRLRESICLNDSTLAIREVGCGLLHDGGARGHQRSQLPRAHHVLPDHRGIVGVRGRRG
jgi:hypothetical protein